MSSAQGNSVRLLRPIAVVLGRLGVDGERFLAEVGIEPTTSFDAYVPSERVDRALEAIASARGDETFSLTLAREAMVRPLGFFSHLVWLSGTVGSALAQAARFYSLVTRRSTLTLAIDQATRIATFRQELLAGATRGNMLLEFAFATFFLRARGAAGERFHARAMRFVHSVRDAAPYEALFEAPVSFGCTHDELELDAAVLDLPLGSADPVTAAAIEQQATQIRAQVEPLPLAERIREAVQAELPASRPSLASVARRLGTGARSLRRQLEGDKISLRAVVASVRRDRAAALLASGASVKDVAFQLGFSEPSAFSRAYKRWTGESPGATALEGPRAAARRRAG
jgi:AraC-like DNA-binding protein